MCAVETTTTQVPDPDDPSKTVTVTTQQLVSCSDRQCPQKS